MTQSLISKRVVPLQRLIISINYFDGGRIYKSLPVGLIAYSRLVIVPWLISFLRGTFRNFGNILTLWQYEECKEDGYWSPVDLNLSHSFVVFSLSEFRQVK